jgi:hypothetical protein
MAHTLAVEPSIGGVCDDGRSGAIEKQINELLEEHGVAFAKRYVIGATWNEQASNVAVGELSKSIATAIANEFKGESITPNKTFTPVKVNLVKDTTGTSTMEVTFFGPAKSEQNS